MNKFCTKCGTRNEGDALFCAKCGNKFEIRQDRVVSEDDEPTIQIVENESRYYSGDDERTVAIHNSGREAPEADRTVFAGNPDATGAGRGAPQFNRETPGVRWEPPADNRGTPGAGRTVPGFNPDATSVGMGMPGGNRGPSDVTVSLPRGSAGVPGTGMGAQQGPSSAGTKICRNCGATIAGDSKFCFSCGSPYEGGGGSAPAGPAFGGPMGPMPGGPAGPIPTGPAIPPGPMGVTPAVPPRKKKKISGAVIAISIIAVLLLAVAGLFAVGYFTDVEIPVVSPLLDKIVKEDEDEEASDEETEDEEDGESESETGDEDGTAEDESSTGEDGTEAESTTEAETTAPAPAALELKKGETVQFGSYPQSLVSDADLNGKLNQLAADLDWISYRYTSGSGTKGSMTENDNMKYVDVEYEGQKYRGVFIASYRPYWSYLQSSAEKSQQDDNGYKTGTNYWFRYEPLSWIVLDESSGLVLSKMAIDSQPHTQEIYTGSSETYLNKNCTYYASDYENSYLRQWLNNDFYNTAFSETEKTNISPRVWNNSSATAKYSKYNSASTKDNIAVLSYSEAINTSYGFSGSVTVKDKARQSFGTDYAKCQGLYLGSGGQCSNAHLRSPGAVRISPPGSIRTATSMRTVW